MKFSRYFLLIAALIVVANPSNLLSQLQGQEKIDSLLSELPKSIQDTNKVILLNKLSIEFITIDAKKGIEYAEKGIKVAEKINWDKGKAINYDIIGIHYNFGFSDFQKSIEYAEKALTYFIKLEDSLGISAVQSNIGNGYLALADYPKALDYYFKSLKIAEFLSDEGGVANVSGNIGIVFFNTAEYSKALEYFRKSYKKYQELGELEGEARNLGNMANVLGVQGETEKSIEYNEKALKIYEKLGQQPNISFILSNLGYAYMYSYNSYKAVQYFAKAFNIDKELGIPESIAYNLRNLGEIYLSMTKDSLFKKESKKSQEFFSNKAENLDKSIEYTLESVKIGEEIRDLNGLSQAYRNLYIAYKKRNELDKSLKAFERYQGLRDTLDNDDNKKKIDSLLRAGEAEINKIKFEKQQIQLAAQKRERDFIIMIAVGIVAAIFIILIVIYTQRKKSDKLLYNVLPISIAKRLKKKEHPISDNFVQASIIFIDIVGFTAMSKDSNPTDIVQALNKIFTHYDSIAKKHGLEKIKTIGDCYMAAAGLPVVQEDNTYRAAKMAL